MTQRVAWWVVPTHRSLLAEQDRGFREPTLRATARYGVLCPLAVWAHVHYLVAEDLFMLVAKSLETNVTDQEFNTKSG